MARCTSRYSAQVRCEESAGHSGQHAHSFFARYWDDDDAIPTARCGRSDPHGTHTGGPGSGIYCVGNLNVIRAIVAD